MDEQEFREDVIGRLSRIEIHVKGLNRRMADAEDDLHGNGDRGLRERLTVLETRSTWPERVIGIVVAAGAAIGTIFVRDKTGL